MSRLLALAIALALAPTQARAADKADKGAKPATKAAAPTAPAEKKARVYTFGAMDVEGKLKTPQLLYFLNRVRLELDTTTPPKRSFIPELEKSSDAKGL